ncbi:fungal-specific transcription factor domain-containing protein [Mrakia frigida]|uniref:Zn(II)2Cys6 transcription factor n=1 Tax=Mrakia frigida TaxID=29902 RepID=UPI003FCC0801
MDPPPPPPLPLMMDSPTSLSASVRPSPPLPSGSMDSTTSSSNTSNNNNNSNPYGIQQQMYPPPMGVFRGGGAGQDEGGAGRFSFSGGGGLNFATGGAGGFGGGGMGVMPSPSLMNGSYQPNNSSVPYHSLAPSSHMPYHPPASISSSTESTSTPTTAAGKKRKVSTETSNGTPTVKWKGKKSKKASAGTDDGDSISPTKEEEDEEAKRTKTSRACDRCRGKKTRCDILPDTDPPLCAHCRNAKLDCTFFLPITETRFKKKRQLEEAAKAAAEGKPYEPPKPTTFPPASTTTTKLPPPHPPSLQPSYPSYPSLPHQQLDVKPSPSSSTIPQRQMSGSSLVGGGGSLSPAGGSGSSERMQERLNARVQGPTSISFLLHSTATIPPHTFDNYDLRHHTAFEISSTGDGLIKVYHPPRSSDPNSPSFNIPSGIESRLAPDIIERLVNSYFQNVAPLFPVVSRGEFLKEGKESPLLLYAICGVAATRRDVPREVFNSLRTTINGIIKHNDVLSDTSLVNIQSLLILSQVGDLHSQPLTAATSAAANRLGVAIRMAQDLGLHRDEITRTDDLTEFEQMEERAFLELKRRIWSACVIMDRWYAASMGMPQIIDLLDCDVLLPDPDEVPLPDRMNEPGARSSPYLYFCEMLKLSILLGRITKTVYGPTGLKHASDHQLNSLLIDMRSWKAALPGPLQFSGPTTSTYQAGILHIYYTALLFLFFRVFMRISYSLPSHLQFSLDVVTWSELVEDSRQAIEWLDKNDHALDTMFLVSYATTSVALVQYHTWARRKDPKALNSMKQLRDIGRRWEVRRFVALRSSTNARADLRRDFFFLPPFRTPSNPTTCPSVVALWKSCPSSSTPPNTPTLPLLLAPQTSPLVSTQPQE